MNLGSRECQRDFDLVGLALTAVVGGLSSTTRSASSQRRCKERRLKAPVGPWNGLMNRILYDLDFRRRHECDVLGHEATRKRAVLIPSLGPRARSPDAFTHTACPPDAKYRFALYTAVSFALPWKCAYCPGKTRHEQENEALHTTMWNRT